jgi:hypothetical protein
MKMINIYIIKYYIRIKHEHNYVHKSKWKKSLLGINTSGTHRCPMSETWVIPVPVYDTRSTLPYTVHSWYLTLELFLATDLLLPRHHAMSANGHISSPDGLKTSPVGRPYIPHTVLIRMENPKSATHSNQTLKQGKPHLLSHYHLSSPSLSPVRVLCCCPSFAYFCACCLCTTSVGRFFVAIVFSSPTPPAPPPPRLFFFFFLLDRLILTVLCPQEIRGAPWQPSLPTSSTFSSSATCMSQVRLLRLLSHVSEEKRETSLWSLRGNI